MTKRKRYRDSLFPEKLAEFDANPSIYCFRS